MSYTVDNILKFQWETGTIRVIESCFKQKISRGADMALGMSDCREFRAMSGLLSMS